MGSKDGEMKEWHTPLSAQIVPRPMGDVTVALHFHKLAHVEILNALARSMHFHGDFVEIQITR